MATKKKSIQIDYLKEETILIDETQVIEILKTALGLEEDSVATITYSNGDMLSKRIALKVMRKQAGKQEYIY